MQVICSNYPCYNHENNDSQNPNRHASVEGGSPTNYCQMDQGEHARINNSVPLRKAVLPVWGETIILVWVKY